MFDQPEFAEPLLRSFLAAHEAELDAVPLRCRASHRYVPGSLSKAGAGSGDGAADGADGAEPSLGAHLRAALDGGDPEMDPTCVMLDALDELALVEEFPVLVAIDDFNWLYEPTEYFYDERYIPPQQLSLVSAFRMFAADDEYRSRVKREYKWQRGEPEYPDHFFSERPPHSPFSLPETPSREPPRMPLANGFVVAAMSHGRLPTDGVSDGQRDSRFRKLVDSRACHRAVRAFDDKELRAQLEHFKATGYLELPPSDQVVAYFKMRYGGVPRSVFEAVPQFFDQPIAEHPMMTETGGRRNKITSK
jgi:hypothetical protein